MLQTSIINFHTLPSASCLAFETNSRVDLAQPVKFVFQLKLQRISYQFKTLSQLTWT